MTSPLDAAFVSMKEKRDRIVIDGAEIAAWVFRGQSFRIEVGRDSAGISAEEAAELGAFLTREAGKIIEERWNRLTREKLASGEFLKEAGETILGGR